MINFTKIQEKATSVMDKLLDSGAETTITYKMFASNTYNDSTGTNETTYSEYEIDAIKVDAALQAQMASSMLAGVGYGAGEIHYLIKASDMPRTDIYSPNVLKDFIDDAGEEKQVKLAQLLMKTFVKLQV
ncbi:MAG: hypothetical protein H8D23_15260 [Candidatus Brocadiales bacterium]|nr:hypothetical protein [Candidatus Brocadiales bacterium]